MNSAKVPAKPLCVMTLSISLRIRRTSWRPMSWISRGVRRVVVDWRTLKAYHASPSGRSESAIVSRVRGRYASAK